MNRILVVDGEDDLANRLLYADELSEEGYEVITAQGDQELLELIEAKSPDLVVVDVTRREDDGILLLEGIRNAYDALPVVISTVYPTAPSTLEAMENDCYLERSTSLEELKSTIKKALHGNEGMHPAGIMERAEQGKAMQSWAG